MTIKEIHTKAGSLSSYVWYIFLLFWWYFLHNIYTAMKPVIPGNPFEPFLDWGFTIVIAPCLLAGVLGGIHEQQRSQRISGIGGFFNVVKAHYGRIMGANLLSIVSFFLIMVAAFVSGILEQPESGDNKTFAYIAIPFSAITLFWFAAIVVERNMIRSLFRTIQTLLFSPFALTIGVIWGVIHSADTTVLDTLGEQWTVALTGITAGVIAFARVLVSAYALAIYKKARVEFFDESSEEAPILIPSSTSFGDRWVKVSFVLAFVSFLPLFHLVALVFGIIALNRKKRFVMRAVIACCIGGFFTFLYLLLIIGWFIGRSTPSDAPAYTFLAEAHADLEPHVMLLEQGLFPEIQQQLEQETTDSSTRHWAFDCASALAKLQARDLDGAFADFRVAAGKKPERSEFYYYYGRALLDNAQEEEAAEQFETALRHEPKLEDAERYLTLIRTAYSPSKTISALWFVIILLFLFTLHEYGHAFAAWKLGDDTAKNQGRLTLNPLAHLDIIGSVLLPGILLWRQSDIIFGWAKPVPVNPENFTDPQKDHMTVSFAGPAINLIVSMVCFVILGCFMLFVRAFWPETLAFNFATPSSSVSLVGPPFTLELVIIIAFLKQLFYTSLVLGCFNLIPVPPLDGSWIFSGLLPQGLRNLFEMVRQYSFVIFLLLVMTPALDYFLAIPIGLAWGLLYVCVLVMGFG